MEVRMLWIVFMCFTVTVSAQMTVSMNCSMIRSETDSKNKQLILSYRFVNDMPFSQVLYLQNWRAAAQKDTERLYAWPYSRMNNKVYFVRKNSDYNKSIEFFKIFDFEEDSQGVENYNSFKVLKPGEAFSINIVITDKALCDIFNTRDYSVNYVYSYCKYSELREIIDEWKTAFVKADCMTVLFNDVDFGSELTLHNFRGNENIEEIQYETSSVLNDKMIPELFKMPDDTEMKEHVF